MICSISVVLGALGILGVAGLINLAIEVLENKRNPS